MTKKGKYLVDVMSKKQKVIYGLLVVFWALSVGSFLYWWTNPSHVISVTRFVINTLFIAWSLLLPGYFFFFAGRMKKPNPEIEIPEGLKVAMIVTKAPSEPFDVLKKTLGAMLAQKYPHDTWLADEDPSDENIKWCKENNVYLITRKGIPEYNRDEWPRRKKCKEGNLAYFYDMVGYEKYHFVCQLDADHVPECDYLEKVLIGFANPKVGYVSAPSICDANAAKSWSARGRLFVEAFLHGSQQAGHTNGFAPLCIGSHYAVRTKALKQIGGIGPELAEDHSTSLLMQAGGWQGVHALDAIAHGDGPATFADAMTQEFQWSKSLAILFTTLTPKKLRHLSWNLKFQFVFSQLWYALFGVVMFSVYLLPIVAILSGRQWVNVSYIEFLVRYSITIITTLSVVLFIRVGGWTRPAKMKILSWEGAVFQFVRWPWVLYGVISGFLTGLAKKSFNFKVTPKGKTDDAILPISKIAPYILIVLINSSLAFYSKSQPQVHGYFYFILVNSILYLLITSLIVVKHVYEYES